MKHNENDIELISSHMVNMYLKYKNGDDAVKVCLGFFILDLDWQMIMPITKEKIEVMV